MSEQVEIDHIYGRDVATALRGVADMLDADDTLCLIGLWNYPEVDPLGDAMLQTVLTRLSDGGSP
jgi:hypothetical protein